MTEWEIECIINFDADDLCKYGFAHFSFHDRNGRQYALFHRQHFLGLVGDDGKLEWTVSAHRVIAGTPNISAELKFPMYIDSMRDGTLVVSNFGNALLHRIDPTKMEAEVFADGAALGMKDAGNCVVDDEGCVWVNEVVGCRMWKFDPAGKPMLTLGDGKPGFQSDRIGLNGVRFNWIYDIRRGPDGNIYVLDSKNFAVRMIDMKTKCVHTLAGTSRPGYTGDKGDALSATFGSNPQARFDGPISLSLDEEGNIFVGDRFNHVVRMIDRKSWIIKTIAGKPESVEGMKNNPQETNPFRINLPAISSMDYYGGRLYIPTDITSDSGDLIVMRRKNRT
jgi:hypothetical protein